VLQFVGKALVRILRGSAILAIGVLGLWYVYDVGGAAATSVVVTLDRRPGRLGRNEFRICARCGSWSVFVGYIGRTCFGGAKMSA
jgi:hypothetical protein